MSRLSRRAFVQLSSLTALGGLLGCTRSAGLTPLNFLFYTDVHAMPERGAPEALGFLASRINALRPDLVIGGGDFIHRGLQSTLAEAEPRFAVYLDFLKKVQMPVEHMIGNHDLIGLPPEGAVTESWNPRGPIQEKLGLTKTWRSFENKGYKIMLLDSVEITPEGPHPYRGFINEEQVAWLADELRQTDKEQPIILGSHIPFRTTFKQILESPLSGLPPHLVLENGNDVLRLFDKHNLLLVLQGHLHFNESIKVNQTTFLMGGAVCGRWWHGPNLGTGEGLMAVGMDPKFVEYRYQNYGWSSPVIENDSPWD
jgi:predicted MPP superfamily phosphohydrolase